MEGYKLGGIDFYMQESGDLSVDPSGDIALTQTDWRPTLQSAYIRLMTDIGDFLLYPQMGCNLSSLYGMPQSPATGQVGINLCQAGLQREGIFAGNAITISAIPTGYQTIRFDVSIASGSAQLIKLSLAQNLGLT